MVASSPRMVSTATSPCVDATCASFGARGSPMQSPIAHTPGMFVRMRSSTVIPRRFVVKPACSTPERFATRPAPRSTCSPSNDSCFPSISALTEPTGPLYLGHLRVRPHFHATLLERADQDADELGVRVGDRLREHLEHGDVASDLGEEGAE